MRLRTAVLGWLAVPAMAGVSAAAEPRYELVASTLTYHVSHLVHTVQGTSRAGRGKGVCKAGVCEFLVAAPLATFDSGDSNRDAHMLQCVRGGEFPLVTVRTKAPDAASAELVVDLAIEFAGRKKTYVGVRFTRKDEGDRVHLTGTLPLVLTDFGVERPSLLTIPIRDAAPVDVDLLWLRR